MSPERWQEIKDVFLETLEQSPRGRPAFLAQACGDDAGLRREVESLLAAEDPTTEDQTLSWLDGPAFEAAASLLTRDPSERPIPQVGPYRLVRELGRGGMGAVYLAERADDAFERQVAVKLLQRGLDSEGLRRRFRQERQILASLDHPHIARLIEGGVTPDGLPYFIMEYVDGLPIDRYCDSHQLDLRQRLALFRRVAQAVHYAHRHLVVHCDLKPSNILVTPEGVPKLLDFGVSKLLGTDYVPQPTAATLPGFELMTPEFASPEQVRRERITTASDIYSLGVLLYRLVTGQPPYRFEGRTASDIERVICELEPERPSMIAAAHRTLPEEIDHIVLMAMHKDPARRYGSMEQFSEDLRRHLEGWTIIARPDSWSYRTGKFIRRYRFISLAVTLVMLSLVTGIVAVTWQAREARAQRERAEIQQAAAEQVADFLAILLRGADPLETHSEAVTVRELLAEGAQEIDRLGGQPAVQARMMKLIGVAYLNLGLYDEALPFLTNALKTRRQALGPESAEVAESLYDLGELLRVQGELQRARSLLRRALELRRKVLDEQAPEVADSLNRLALVLRDLGEFQQAEPLYLQALALNRRLGGDRRPEIAANLHNLGGLLRARGRYAEAEALVRESLALHRELLGEKHPKVATGLNLLAVVLKDQGDYEEAERCYREALTIQRRALGDEHADVARSLSNLAGVLYARGEYDDAEPLFLEALELYRRLMGERHPQVANPLTYLGALRHRAGDDRQAQEYLRESLELRREHLGSEHPAVAISLIQLGKVLLDQGQARDAEEVLREGLRIRQAKLPQDHWRTAVARSVLGGCLTALERYEEAEASLLQGFENLTAQPRRQEAALDALNRLIALYEAWGRSARADHYRALAARMVAQGS